MSDSPKNSAAVAAVQENRSETSGGESSAHSSGLLRKPLLLVLATALISALASGGLFLYLYRSGKLSPAKATAGVTKLPVTVPQVVQSIALDPLVVNLADEGGSAYLRLAATLRVVASPVSKDSETKGAEKGTGAKLQPGTDAEIRDTLLAVLSRHTAASLLSSDGKQELKQELVKALTGHVEGWKVEDIFFTEFLVQQ